MKIGLVTDSTADIPANLVEKLQIEVVPAILVIDGKSYIDGIDISREEFYERMPSFKKPATTAAASSGEFMERYEKLFTAGAEKIFSIHTASQLSGIFNAARLAAESFGERVQLVDSGQLSLGIGFQVLEAAEAIAKGQAFEETSHLLQHIQKRIKLSAALDTLEYLRRSGRVSWAKARMAALLSLKPLIGLAYGKVENLGAVRTTKTANLRLMELLHEAGKIKKLAILHTNAEERARQFLSDFAPSFQKETLVVNVTPVIGTHLGPKGIGFTALQE
ncbi:MAG: DegV family protein [Chloroflexi bacterium]|nr:DegV family protein [Chloroflexota bacterium]